MLAASDLYDYDYSDYYTTGSYSVTFGGENKLTAAIYRITSGEELHAYYTTNHGEQRLTDTLTDALEGQNLSVSPLDLLTDTIPEDCDLLIINDPQQDVASAGGLVDEMSALRAYLKKGGHLMLTTDSYYSTPNLDALMAEFGLTRTTGLVVEGDSRPLPERLPLLSAAGLRHRHRERHAGRHRHQPPRPAADGAGHHHH